MSSLVHTTLKDRMAMLSVTSTEGMTPALRAAIDHWYSSEPFPEWVLFIILVPLPSYNAFYTAEGKVRWTIVVRKFKYELKTAGAMGLADIPLMAAGNRQESTATLEAYNAAVQEAKDEIPPKIQELLLLMNIRMQDGAPGLYENPFYARYRQLRAEAMGILRGWLVDKHDGDYRDALPHSMRDEEMPSSQPPTVPASPVRDDRAVGGAAMQRAVEDTLSRMAGLTEAEQIELMRRLVRDHGCEAATLLCMSERGRRLGVCENERLWEQLSRDQGWSTPPIARMDPGEPQQVLVRKEKFALVLYRKRSWTEHRDAEYATLPGKAVPVYNWHSYYMQRCADKRM